MPESAEEAILGALNAKLATPAFTPTLAIAWPNVKFTPTVGTPYLRATILRGETVQSSLGSAGLNRHVGLYQIDVFYPVEKGEVLPLQIASQIVERFKRGTSMTRSGVTVRVEAPPSILPMMIDNGWAIVPVRVRWFCDAANPS